MLSAQATFDSFLQAGARCERSFNIAVNYFGAKNRSADIAPEVNMSNLPHAGDEACK